MSEPDEAALKQLAESYERFRQMHEEKEERQRLAWLRLLKRELDRAERNHHA